MLFKGWECLSSTFNVQCLFYPTFLLLVPFLSCVLGHSPHYYPVAFLGRCAQVFQIYNNRKITDPHFQEKKCEFQTTTCQQLVGGNIFKVLHVVQLDLQFCHMQRHVRWHVKYFIPISTNTLCVEWTFAQLYHDGCDSKESVRGPQKCTNLRFNCSVRWKCNLGDECPFYKVFFSQKSW